MKKTRLVATGAGLAALAAYVLLLESLYRETIGYTGEPTRVWGNIAPIQEAIKHQIAPRIERYDCVPLFKVYLLARSRHDSERNRFAVDLYYQMRALGTLKVGPVYEITPSGELKLHSDDTKE